MIDYTVTVAVDDRTAEQLKLVWPTWKRYRPAFFNRPLLVICDAQIGGPEYWESRLSWLEHPDRQLVAWDCPDCPHLTQRERMLTGWVKVPPRYVETEYWLKIDTDSVAKSAAEWIDETWFQELPALVTNPWGYTKPAHWPHLLDTWARSVPQLASGAPVGLPFPRPGQDTIKHSRIAGWLCFVRTDFSRKVLEFVPGRLPVPSQDTYHWYCAQRLGEPIVKVRFRKRGWDCIHSDRRRKQAVEEIMAQPHEMGTRSEE